MLFDLATFVDSLGPAGQLVLLLVVGVPAMLASVSITSRAASAASASARASEPAGMLVEERVRDR